MFCLPELKERQVSKLVESYGEKRNRFPYTMYVVGALSVEVGNILYNDEKFVSYLYRRNGDMFDDLSKVTDASDEIKKVRADFIAAQTMEIVDPINITTELTVLEKEINDFVVEIDSALSVSNALTELEIAY